MRATIEIVDPPVVPRIYFWALQASFITGRQTFGGAHLGLQFHPDYPNSRAANWGGYHDGALGGGVLDGTPLSLPSAVGNANTCNFPWQARTPYTLRIRRGSQGWAGSVTDPSGEEQVLRELLVEGTHLRSPLVWTECFADCDAPPTAIEWSDLAVVGESGNVHGVHRVSVNYQTFADGGCSTSNSRPAGGGPGRFVQETGVARTVTQGSVLGD